MRPLAVPLPAVPPPADSLPLSHLSAAESGSETVEQKKPNVSRDQAVMYQSQIDQEGSRVWTITSTICGAELS